MKQLLNKNQWSGALKSFEKQPYNHLSATSLISHVNKSLSNLSLALSVYETFKASPQSKPNSFMFTALVYAYQNHGGPSQIASLWHDILHYRYN